MDKLRCYYVPHNGLGKVVHIEGDELTGLQRLVEGNIESMSWLFDDKPAVYVNEEGKYTCLPNRAVRVQEHEAGNVGWDGHVFEEGELVDIIFGNFVCVGFDWETGESRDITDEEIERVRARFDNDDMLGEGYGSGSAAVLRIKTGVE